MSLKFAKAALTAFVALSLATSKSNAIVLGNYTFENNSLTASNVAPGVSFSDFSYNPDATPGKPDFAAGNPGLAYLSDNWPVDIADVPPPNQGKSISIRLDIRNQKNLMYC